MYQLDRMDTGGSVQSASERIELSVQLVASATVEVLLSRDLVGSDSRLVWQRHSEPVVAAPVSELMC